MLSILKSIDSAFDGAFPAHVAPFVDLAVVAVGDTVVAWMATTTLEPSEYSRPDGDADTKKEREREKEQQNPYLELLLFACFAGGGLVLASVVIG